MSMPDAPPPALRQLFALAAAPSRLLASLEAGPSGRGPWREPALADHALLSEALFSELLRADPAEGALAAAVAPFDQKGALPPAAEATQSSQRAELLGLPASERTQPRPSPVRASVVRSSVTPLHAAPAMREASPPVTRDGRSLPTRARARATFEQRAERAGLGTAFVTPLASHAVAGEPELGTGGPVESSATTPSVAQIRQKSPARDSDSAAAAPPASVRGTAPFPGGVSGSVEIARAGDEVEPDAPLVGMAGLVARLERLTRGGGQAAPVHAPSRRDPGSRPSAPVNEPSGPAALRQAPWRAGSARESATTASASDDRVAPTSVEPEASLASRDEVLPRIAREQQGERDLAERIARILHREAERDGIDLEGFEP